MDARDDMIRNQQRFIEQLLAENKDLRVKAEQGDLSRRPFRFLDLPAELRSTVYELCLCVGKVFPRPSPHADRCVADFKTYRKPETQLLLVSHQVCSEAAKIYFGKNHFVISCGFYSSNILDSSYDDGSNSSLAAKYVRSLSITFDMRETDAIENRAGGLDNSLKKRDCDIEISADQLAEYHSAVLAEVVPTVYGNCLWQGVCDFRLRFLQINFTHCFCPFGCCRNVAGVDGAAYQLQSAWTKEAWPKTIESMGLLNDYERAAVCAAFRRAIEAAETSQGPEIRFTDKKGNPSSGDAIAWGEVEKVIANTDKDLGWLDE